MLPGKAWVGQGPVSRVCQVRLISNIDAWDIPHQIAGLHITVDKLTVSTVSDSRSCGNGQSEQLERTLDQICL